MANAAGPLAPAVGNVASVTGSTASAGGIVASAAGPPAHVVGIVANAAGPAASGVVSGASAADRPAGNVKNKQKQKPPRPTYRDKLIRDITCQRVAATTAFNEVARGVPQDQAIEIGIARAGDYAKSHAMSRKIIADSMKKAQPKAFVSPSGYHQPTPSRASSQSLPSPGTSQSHIPPSPPSHDANHPSESNDGRWYKVGDNKNKNRNKRMPKYSKGTGDNFTGPSIARSKPEYLRNRVLVVSGMPENITKPQINNWIVGRAKNLSGREIVLPYIARLERDNTRHTTVAIEIKPEDYALLSRSDFWEKAIRIKKWVGWRFWRGQPRQTPQSSTNSVRRTWDS